MFNSKWSIVQINCRPLLDGKTNVVHEVIWQCKITSDENPDEHITHSELMQIPYTSGVFTDYSQLTEEQVVGWVKERLEGLAPAIEASLTEQLRIKLLPPSVTLDLPWKQ